MQLFQYWDGAEPPAQIVALTDGVAQAAPGLAYRRYDHAAAAAFIAAHQGDAAAAAFADCAVPAMQADLARLCFIDACGGLYLDADLLARGPLDGLVEQAAAPLMLTNWAEILNNSVIAAAAPGNAFVRACLDLAIDNVRTRRFDCVLMSVGPGVLNAVRRAVDPGAREAIDYCCLMAGWGERGWTAMAERAEAAFADDAAVAAAWRATRLLHVDEVDRWLGITDPDYKTTDRHWLNWPGSIYR